MQIQIDESESAELEFRKAIYKHKFDRNWYIDLQQIEIYHYSIMGAIYEFTKYGASAEYLTQNPLEL